MIELCVEKTLFKKRLAENRMCCFYYWSYVENCNNYNYKYKNKKEGNKLEATKVKNIGGTTIRFQHNWYKDNNVLISNHSSTSSNTHYSLKRYCNPSWSKPLNYSVIKAMADYRT